MRRRRTQPLPRMSMSVTSPSVFMETLKEMQGSVIKASGLMGNLAESWASRTITESDLTSLPSFDHSARDAVILSIGNDVDAHYAREGEHSINVVRLLPGCTSMQDAFGFQDRPPIHWVGDMKKGLELYLVLCMSFGFSVQRHGGWQVTELAVAYRALVTTTFDHTFVHWIEAVSLYLSNNS